MARFDQEAPAQARRIGRYEVLGEIASGGMATVYLSRSIGAKGFSRLVAIKRLHPHLEAEDDFVQMFLDEARLAARIRHPNVVATLDVEDSEGLYIVMEYIEGVTLLMLWRQAAKLGERMPVPVAARIILDTLGGLHAAHELLDDNGDFLNLVHRDVSPQNILLGVDGVSRITDFGIAKASSRLTMTRDGQLKGKISYMAPEQTKRVEIDRRVDLFAMGIVAWEVLAGKRLFSGESDVEVLNQLLFEPIPRLKDHAPSVPSGMEQVVMRALDRDPQQRWSTAHEFADGIERAMKPLGGPANHRTVATYIQKISGERIAREKGRIANGSPPTDGNTTGSFKALDGPPVTPSRVRSAPPGTRPPQPAIPQRPTTPAPGGLSPQRPTTPPPGTMQPARARPATLAPGGGPGMQPLTPARGPLPPPPGRSPGGAEAAARRTPRSTMMGIGEAPPQAPVASAPRKPLDLTYEEEFDEEMPTIQASVSPTPSGVRPAGVAPRASSGFSPQAPAAPPRTSEPSPERGHRPTPSGPSYAEPKSPGLPSFALPPDHADDPSMAPRPALDPWASPVRESSAPTPLPPSNPGYDGHDGLEAITLKPSRGPIPGPMGPAYGGSLSGPAEVDPAPRAEGANDYSIGHASHEVGASGYSLGSRPPVAEAPLVVPEKSSRRGVAVALGIVVLGALVAGAIVLRGNELRPTPNAGAPLQTAAPVAAPTTPEGTPPGPTPTPPAAAAPQTPVPPSEPAPAAPAAAPAAPPEPAPVAAPSVPPEPAPVAPAAPPAPVVAAPAPAAPSRGRSRRHRRNEDDDDPTALVGIPAALTVTTPVAAPTPRTPVAAPAPAPAPRPVRPRNNQPDPDAPDLGDPYR